jgi:hypothetical protein
MSLARGGATDHALEGCKRFVCGARSRLFDRVRRVGGRNRIKAIRPQLDSTAFVYAAARPVDLTDVNLDPRNPLLNVSKASFNEGLNLGFDIHVAVHLIVTVELE